MTLHSCIRLGFSVYQQSPIIVDETTFAPSLSVSFFFQPLMFPSAYSNNTKDPTTYAMRVATLLLCSLSFYVSCPDERRKRKIILSYSSSCSFSFHRTWQSPGVVLPLSPFFPFLDFRFISMYYWIAFNSVPALSINPCQKDCARRGASHLQRQQQTFSLTLYSPPSRSSHFFFFTFHFFSSIYFNFLLLLFRHFGFFQRKNHLRRVRF